jgi:hypothetical protein
VSSLKTGEKATDNYTKTLTDFGKKAALAFAVAGAAVGAFAVASVKAALADESAQRKLEETIRATTNASADQVAAVAKYIDTTAVAVGVTDDELRPAFSRLVRSTKDVEEAQKLTNLALDLAIATGKPLESISNALGRAYDGNTTSLGRLGLGLDANLIKSKDTDAIFKTLTETFGNFAENEALTTEAQFRRVGSAVDEAKVVGDLDEANAVLDEATGEEAALAEFGAVVVAQGGGFFLEVEVAHELGSGEAESLPLSGLVVGHGGGFSDALLERAEEFFTGADALASDGLGAGETGGA